MDQYIPDQIRIYRENKNLVLNIPTDVINYAINVIKYLESAFTNLST